MHFAAVVEFFLKDIYMACLIENIYIEFFRIWWHLGQFCNGGFILATIFPINAVKN